MHIYVFMKKNWIENENLKLYVNYIIDIKTTYRLINWKRTQHKIVCFYIFWISYKTTIFKSHHHIDQLKVFHQNFWLIYFSCDYKTSAHYINFGNSKKKYNKREKCSYLIH